MIRLAHSLAVLASVAQPFAARRRVRSATPRLAWALVILPALTSTAHAQVIRSYESMDRSAGERYYATADVSLDGSGGNADYVDLELSGALGFRGVSHWLRLYPSYHLKRSDGRDFVLERSAHLRHSYFLTPRTRSYAFVQVQTDRSIDLERRTLVGGGVRRRFIELGGGGVDVGVGVMFERERVKGERGRSSLRGANLFSVYGDAGSVSLSGTGYVQPVLDEPGDHRLAVVLGATVPLGSILSLNVSTHWRRDSRPPPAIEKDDVGMSLGLRLTAN